MILIVTGDGTIYAEDSMNANSNDIAIIRIIMIIQIKFIR